MSLHDVARRYFLKRAASGVVAVAVAGSGPMQSRATSEAGTTGEYDIKAFGAKGDGKTLDTAAINKAIETAAAAGGGTVQFPAGSYLCYSIHLKSNITLHLGPGATILAADPVQESGTGYDPPEPNAWDKYQDFGHSH